MPWPPEQMRAIAASLRRQGKSTEQIRRFFHEHGHGGSAREKMTKHLSKSKRKRRR